MKKGLFLVVFVLLWGGTATVQAKTESGECGAEGANVTWKFDTETGLLEISGTGAMKDYNYYESGFHGPWYDYRSLITSVTIGESITCIGEYAFAGCTGLTEVALPEGVTTIGSSAFSGCTDLTSVTIPENVTAIGDYAFRGCTGLSSITISNSVTSIGKKAFFDCTVLASVTIPNSVSTIKESTFENCIGLKEIIIGYSVETIEAAAFKGCSGLKKITSLNTTPPIITTTTFDEETAKGATLYVPASCKDIYWLHPYWENFSSIENSDYKAYDFEENGIYYHINGSTERTVEVTYKTPSDRGYSGEVIIPEEILHNDTLYTVTSISGYAFHDCKALAAITVGKNIARIGNGAFSGCTGLKNLRIEEGTETLKLGTSSSATPFDNCPLDTVYLGRNIDYRYYSSGYYNPFKNKTDLVSLTIGNQVTSIDYSAFSGCSGLKNLRIEDGTKTLKISTSSSSTPFDNCPLDTVYLGRNISYSYYSPFENKTSLVSLTIGNQVTSIDNSAFSGCSGLKNLRIEDGTKTLKLSTSSSSTPFDNCPLDTVYLGRNIDYSYSSGYNTYYNSPFKDKTNLISLTIGNQVTSIDNSAFSGCMGLAEITIPNSVTTIGSSAFYRCSGLTSVTIGNNVTTIGTSAFSGCSGLKEIWFNADSCISGGFSNCTALTTVHIGENVKRIPDEAFSGCTGLTEVTIPNNISVIGNNAFNSCNKLTDVWFNADSCISGGFSYCTTLATVHIGKNVKRIPNEAFYGCTGLTSITIPESVTTIGSSAFYRCSGLTSVTIGNNVTTIGTSAFSGCTNLKNLRIEEGTETLSLSTSSSVTPFDNCPLDTVYLGRNIDYSYSSGSYGYIYHNSPFKNKTSLVSLTIGNKVTAIGEEAFYKCSGLTEITIPNSITSCGNTAFSSCSGLKSVTIGRSVTTIGEKVFSYCNKLEKFEGKFASSDHRYLVINDTLCSFAPSGLSQYTIPDDIKGIGNAAFYGCTGLTSVTIPESITSIGKEAFYDCTNLREITPLGTIPPSINDNTFDQYIYQNATVNYPKGSLHIYKNTDGWKNFTYPSVQTILDLQIDSNIGETTGRITISYTPDMEYPVRGLSFCMGEEQFTFDSTQTAIPLTFADLEPQTRYESIFIIESIYGDQVVIPVIFTTNTVKFITQPAINISNTSATLTADIECDALTGAGFEWRRYDDPELVPSTLSETPIVNGKISGTLRNLSPEKYYKYRPFYRTAKGKYYYGAWLAFGTLDVYAYFEPTVSTRTGEVRGNTTTLSGYIVEGSDEIISQGFEYWAESPAGSITAGEHKRVEGSGSLMNVTLTGLDYNTIYYYRAYATTAKKTTYGNTESFTTGENPNPSGIEETEAEEGFAVRLSGNPVRNGEIGVQVVGADGATWYRVISLHGAQIAQGVLSGTDEWQPVKIPAASTGYYLLQIIGSKGTKTLRIVVE